MVYNGWKTKSTWSRLAQLTIMLQNRSECTRVCQHEKLGGDRQWISLVVFVFKLVFQVFVLSLSAFLINMLSLSFDLVIILSFTLITKYLLNPFFQLILSVILKLLLYLLFRSMYSCLLIPIISPDNELLEQDKLLQQMQQESDGLLSLYVILVK